MKRPCAAEAPRAADSPSGRAEREPVRTRLRPDSLLFPAALLGLLFLGLGCAGTAKPASAPPATARDDIPGWAATGNSPKVAGSVCAVGIAGPTFFRFDAVEIACDAARSALARTLRVKIHATSVDIQTTEGGARDTQTVLEVAAYVNELVLEGSRIVEVWYDDRGVGFARKPQYTYALACIDEASVPALPGAR